MAQLAIKGHATRGKEIIEILEMLGGTNKENCWGIFDTRLYLINILGDIEDISLSDNSNYQIYTLEEFLEKYPYKVGDKVKNARINDFIGRIKNIRWDDNENQIIYVVEWDDVTKSTLSYFAKGLQPYKEETMEEKKINQMSLANCELDEVEIFLGDKFELKIKEGKYYAVKKQPQYPKTYVECAKILVCFSAVHIDGYRCELLEKLQELIVCRDAYWKIAGEQMGLDKPWEPDIVNGVYTASVINRSGNVAKDSGFDCENKLLMFHSDEVRNKFLECFGHLITVCKDLI